MIISLLIVNMFIVDPTSMLYAITNQIKSLQLILALFSHRV